MQISKEQVYSLAKPIADKIEAISEFFKDPRNETDYRNWHYEKYGTYPAEVGQ